MKFNNLLFAFAFVLGVSTMANAQTASDASASMPAKDTSSWTFGGGFGLDLAGLGIINPQLSSGGNRLGFGGLFNVFANQKNQSTSGTMTWPFNSRLNAWVARTTLSKKTWMFCAWVPAMVMIFC